MAAQTKRNWTKDKTTGAQVKQIYAKYSDQVPPATHKLVSELTGIPVSTLETWTRGHRNPTPYMVSYVDDMLARYYDRPENNVDLLRFMTDEEITSQFKNFVDQCLSSGGVEAALPYVIIDMKALVRGNVYASQFDRLVAEGKCRRLSDFNYPFPDDADECCKLFLDFYNSIDITYKAMSKITNVSVSTLSNWGKKQMVLKPYIFKYLYRKTVESMKKVENNLDVIRIMNSDELIKLLTEIRDDAMQAKGNKNAMKKFANIETFLYNTELVAPDVYNN